ncbi:MAG: diguanylate cyclase [Oscillospiraceae bacterium]|jgi:diguanylate cyclase (GGDEF)-like protein|nr:diguanylate cyclase [Oscillospiraceae bacterium]
MEKEYSVLAVDDETTNLILLNVILSPDYTVLTAKSGAEALRRAEKDKPDLILLDIILPDINGFEVLSRLKESPETRDIPVIIITGLTEENDEERGFFLGAVDYITKPFKNGIVRARVNTHMQILRYIRTIERLGLVDPMLYIANKRSFDVRFVQEWRKSGREQAPISFMMIDIDKFKSYNDTYGHPQGDILLQNAARVFRTAAKRPSDLAARLGGDEFGVLLPNTSAEEALAIAESIRAEIDALRIPTNNGTNTVTTVSIGLTTHIPKEDEDTKDFLSKTQKNLHLSKTTGRNKITAN